MTNRMRGVIALFESEREKRSEEWPGVLRMFEKAFVSARTERAAYTPYLNVLEAFGLRTRELLHSKVLAWFLAEKETHEQGSRFLQCLAKACKLVPPPHANYVVQREKPERVDIAIFQNGKFAIFIENKVQHVERSRQLADMVDSLVRFGDARRIPISKRIAVFLTDNGRMPKTGPVGPVSGFDGENLFAIKRLVLFTAFEESVEREPNSSPLLRGLLSAYLTGISSHKGTYE